MHCDPDVQCSCKEIQLQYAHNSAACPWRTACYVHLWVGMPCVWGTSG
jgi:hypothetical protein